MSFKVSFCNPFQADIVDLGYIQKEEVVNCFESIDWIDYLRIMESAKEAELHYSPSLSIHTMDGERGLEISAVGVPGEYEFYIFYMRPKKTKKFFGLRDGESEEHISSITGQTRQDTIVFLNALIESDYDFLETKIDS